MNVFTEHAFITRSFKESTVFHENNINIKRFTTNWLTFDLLFGSFSFGQYCILPE